jgi:hypothetical protein
MTNAPDGDTLRVNFWNPGTGIRYGIMSIFDLLPNVRLTAWRPLGATVTAMIVNQSSDSRCLKFTSKAIKELFFEQSELDCPFVSAMLTIIYSNSSYAHHE